MQAIRRHGFWGLVATAALALIMVETDAAPSQPEVAGSDAPVASSSLLRCGDAEEAEASGIVGVLGASFAVEEPLEAGGVEGLVVQEDAMQGFDLGLPALPGFPVGITDMGVDVDHGAPNPSGTLAREYRRGEGA